MLYMWRGPGHSVVISPSGAHGMDDIMIHSKEEWIMSKPWFELPDLMELDGSV
jgi:hypothetical protein